MTDGMISTPEQDKPLTIRLAHAADWPGIWAILAPIIRGGEHYALDRAMSEEEARGYWLEPDKAVFVAVDQDVAGNEDVVGSYYLRANSAGPGGHVSNAGYIVRSDQRGRGVATSLCVHSIEEARRQGYRAMQFNLVVSCNVRAVRLWQHLGFSIVGTLPGAFRHPQLGYVEAHVMVRSLIEGDTA